MLLDERLLPENWKERLYEQRYNSCYMNHFLLEQNTEHYLQNQERDSLDNREWHLFQYH